MTLDGPQLYRIAETVQALATAMESLSRTLQDAAFALDRAQAALTEEDDA